jgi:hypothetical protein
VQKERFEREMERFRGGVRSGLRSLEKEPHRKKDGEKSG